MCPKFVPTIVFRVPDLSWPYLPFFLVWKRQTTKKTRILDRYRILKSLEKKQPKLEKTRKFLAVEKTKEFPKKQGKEGQSGGSKIVKNLSKYWKTIISGQPLKFGTIFSQNFRPPKPPENRRKSGLFWASPFTMHLVCTLLKVLEKYPWKQAWK